MLTFSEDIDIEFCLKKFGVVILKKVKLAKFDGTHLPNQKMMKEIDENGYTFLGILESDEIREPEMKIKVKAAYKMRLKLVDIEIQIEW